MKVLFQTSVAGLLLSLLAFPALAGTDDIRAANNAIEFDVGGSNIKYGESVNNATFDTETGWMPSLQLGYTYLAPTGNTLFSNLYMHVEGQMSFGDTHYDGGLQNLNTGVVTPFQSTTKDVIYHLSTRAGRLFTLADGWTLTPYGDLGFRSWRRQLTGTGAYTELYQEGEGMGGLLLQASPMPRLVLSFSGAAGETFGAEMSTGGTTYDLGSTTVWQLDGKAGYALTPSFELTGDVRMDGFGFGRSPVKGNAYEPDSYTHQLSIMGGIAYHLHTTK